MAKRAASARKVKAGGKAAPVVRAFDAGKSQRRLKSVPTSQASINSQIRRYGKTVLARSRYLAANNSYAAQSKKTFVSALVGCGIKPSPLTSDPNLKKNLQQAWRDWTDEADADGLTDFYGLQSTIASEMFEAGECFVRLRPRRPEDGLSVPLQLQLLPSEMLPLDKNEDLGNGRRIECGIETNAIGKRVAYHFLRQHPNNDLNPIVNSGDQYSIVPAEQVLHLFDSTGSAGQLRGLPHTLSAIVKLAILDCYDDAELERKRTAALFGAFVERPLIDDGSHPLGAAGTLTGKESTESGDTSSLSFGLEPGATVELQPGEKISFSEPADVGGSYEMFQYRTLLAVAAGFGVPYAAMTGDLRQTSYGSIRAGLVEFRRRVEAMQHSVMVFQFCRPIWQRWIADAVLAGAVGIAPALFQQRKAELQRVKWMPPKWEWIDPLKDLQAEKLAVDNGFKARSDVQEANGYDPDETDQRISDDQKRAEKLGLNLENPNPPAPAAGASPDNPDDEPKPADDAGADGDRNVRH